MNRVILHAGIHKTGSSSIQKSIYSPANSELLTRAGIHVIRSLPANHSQFLVSGFGERPDRYHANARRGLTRAEIEEISERTKRNIVDEVSRVKDQTIIFTGEDTCVLTESGLASVRSFLTGMSQDDVQLKIIVYSRHPAAYVESAVQQNVKRNNLDIDSALMRHLHISANRYLMLYKRLATVFGDNSVEFRSFEIACQSPGGIVNDFLCACGHRSIELNSIHENSSLSANATRVLSHLNSRKVKISKKDFEICSALPGLSKGLLTEAQLVEIERLSSRDREFLAQRYDIHYSSMSNVIPDQSELGSDSDLLKSQLALALPRLDQETQNALRDFPAHT